MFKVIFFPFYLVKFVIMAAFYIVMLVLGGISIVFGTETEEEFSKWSTEYWSNF